MIPKRIQLHNFLSYRDCTVDFAGLHVAVLTGRNGDGKSALLDGMTWAVWGECRGRTEDERLRLGAPEMLVRFEFEAMGRGYEVVRKRTRNRSTGELHFFVLDDDGTRRSVTGGTVRETQDEISRRLGMDYQTFSNSAFVAQGQAGEFTRQSAPERKTVFRKILGLELYEELAKSAGTRSKDAGGKLAGIERNVAEARETIAAEPERAAQLESATLARQGLAPKIEAADQRRGELRLVAQEHDRLEAAVTAASAQLRRAEQARQAAAGEAVRLQQETDEAGRVVARGPEIEERHNRLQVCRARDNELQALQDQALDLQRRVERAEGRIREEAARLEAAQTAKAREIQRFEGAAGGLPDLERRAEALAGRQADVSRGEQEVQRLNAVAQAAGERHGAAIGEADAHKQAAQELKDKAATLEGQPVCPVCRKPLRPQELEQVQADYAAQRRALGEAYRQAQARAAAAQQEAGDAKATAAKLQTELEALRNAVAKDDRDVHAALAMARDASLQLAPAREALSLIDAQLTGKAFAQPFLAAIEEATVALTALGYAADEHAAVRRELRELSAFEEDYARYRSASARLGVLQEAFDRAARDRATCEEAVTDAVAVQTEAQRLAAEAGDVSSELKAAEDSLAALRADDERFTREIGQAEGHLEAIRALKARLEMALDEVRGLRDERDTYETLQKAFGRDGVQAMLIDQAIPHLEVEANRMLDHMTAGRISLQLATQRRLQSGAVRETLDIKISDDLGSRDYEMYSGGEAFRVDFALRIALAKLLANTKGAELPTLIIDEGFGSQDAEGIDRLVEAIQAISAEFRLILVVTHVEELKERFERRIEVTKDPELGSIARVV
ncbi:MAG: AAA family ATPase [Dehalococcoidia bacterium]